MYVLFTTYVAAGILSNAILHTGPIIAVVGEGEQGGTANTERPHQNLTALHP